MQASVAHWIERYGLKEVLQWRFTILSFNYAQLPESPMDYADYLDMYCTTYRILKDLITDCGWVDPAAFRAFPLRRPAAKGCCRI